MQNPREKIFNEMQLEMHGPSARDHFQSQNEELTIQPQKTYSCGVLFPKEKKFEEEDFSETEVESSDEEEILDGEFQFMETDKKENRLSKNEKSANIDDIN